MNDDDGGRFEFDAEDRSGRWSCSALNFLVLIAPLAGVVLLIALSFDNEVGPFGPSPFLDDTVTSSISSQRLPAKVE